MYHKNKMQKSSIVTNDSYQGETLEGKIRRFMNNKEPLGDESPLIYTERQDGIQAAYDIRTDRWEIAVEAMDKVGQSKLAARRQKIDEKTYDTMSEEQKTEFHRKYPQSKIKPIQAGEGKP